MKVIQDGNKVFNVKHAPLKAFDWADLSERLIAILLSDPSEKGVETSSLAKAFAGFSANAPKNIKMDEALPSVLSSIAKGLGGLPKAEKKSLYDEIFKTLTIETDEGAQVPVSVEVLNNVLEKPSTFYVFVGYAIQEHFSFLLDTASDRALKPRS